MTITENTGMKDLITEIVNWMCDNDFMCGFFGDTSQSWRMDKIEELVNDLSDKELRDWLLGNKFNIGHLEAYKYAIAKL